MTDHGVRRFRKRPVIVEAVQFTGSPDNATAVLAFAPTAIWYFNHNSIAVPTLEGTMHANKGDWIVRGIKGEFYPVKPDIFEATYEEVVEL